VSEKPRLRPAGPTTGAMKVAVGLVGLTIVTTGSPGFITCVHRNGPLTGVLPAELRVTVVPAVIGLAEPLKLATACAIPPGTLFGEQEIAGVTSSGNGLSWPTVCVACGTGTSARRAFSWISSLSNTLPGTGHGPVPLTRKGRSLKLARGGRLPATRSSGKMNSGFGSW